MGSRESEERSNVSTSKAVKNLVLAAIGSVALAASLVVLDSFKVGNRLIQALQSAVTLSQSEPKVDVRSMVVQQIRGASELTTAIYAMETVVPTSRDRTLGGYVIGRTTLLYIAHGEVRAGVDLSKITSDDVRAVGDTVSLRLPPPQILDSKIDVMRSKVYDYDRGFLGLGPDVAPELQELAQRETLERIVETACSNGILQEANNRAELTVEKLLTAAGYADPLVDSQPALEGACRIPDSAGSPSTSNGQTP